MKNFGKKSFTLFELLLTLVLIVGFLTAAIITILPSSESSNLNEGVTNFETLLVFCRANAIHIGKPLKIKFTNIDDEFKSISVMYNSNPLQNPGVFQKFGALDELVSNVNKLVKFKTRYDKIEWRADGSSDSIDVQLLSKTSDDNKYILMKINGDIGTIRKTTLTNNLPEIY